MTCEKSVGGTEFRREKGRQSEESCVARLFLLATLTEGPVSVSTLIVGPVSVSTLMEGPVSVSILKKVLLLFPSA